MALKQALFVDDQPEYIAKIVDLIKCIGFDCKVTSNPVEAITLLQRDEFDLVITDILMPGKDGFAVIDTVRSLSAENYIIAVSGSMDEEVGQEAIVRGAHAFFPKPLDLEAFVHEVTSIHHQLSNGKEE